MFKLQTLPRRVGERALERYGQQRNATVETLTMSSSEAENFDLDNVSGTESDDYSPPAKQVVSVFVWTLSRVQIVATRLP